MAPFVKTNFAIFKLVGLSFVVSLARSIGSTRQQVFYSPAPGGMRFIIEGEVVRLPSIHVFGRFVILRIHFLVFNRPPKPFGKDVV